MLVVFMQPHRSVGGSEMNDDNSPDLLTEAAIANALELTRARVAKAEHERADLDRAIASAREEERLLQRLLDVRRGVSPREEARNQKESDSGNTPSVASASVSGPRHPAVQAVIDELATAARPLHISELMRLLRDRNVVIPGAGAQANLITHLRRDARLIRTSRGMYGLSAWGIESMEPGRRVRRQRKRLRAIATK